MKPLKLPAVLGLAALCASPADAAPLASHGPEFFEKLLVDRAFIYIQPAIGRHDIASYVLRPGGAALICTRGKSHRLSWRTTASKRYRALIVLYLPNQPVWRRVSVYDGESGRLHQEAWHRADLRYVTLTDGWVQESWPRVLADACPDLLKDLPEGLAINERQTAENLEELRGQDPDAPLRRFPGWENAGLGAGASRQDLAAFLEARDGEILAGLDGAAYALALGARGGDELWRLDDAGGVAETYHLRPRAGALAFRPEGGAGEWSYRIGDPFPLLPTGERYGAMRLMDWLAGRDGVALPFHGVTARFRFGPAGAVEAARKDGGGVPGAWAWSRGDLVVSLEGVAQGVRYRWRDLAAHTGWKWQG